MARADEFRVTEEIDGHRWGRFTASSLLGGLEWEVCFHCGMVRRADKNNSPCRGVVRVQPRQEGRKDG